jgi:hypothetical protein
MNVIFHATVLFLPVSNICLQQTIKLLVTKNTSDERRDAEFCESNHTFVLELAGNLL